MIITTSKNGTITEYVFAPEHESEAIAFYTKAYKEGLIDGYALMRGLVAINLGTVN